LLGDRRAGLRLDRRSLLLRGRAAAEAAIANAPTSIATRTPCSVTALVGEHRDSFPEPLRLARLLVKKKNDAAFQKPVRLATLSSPGRGDARHPASDHLLDAASK
jgi:hypothetical protein